MRRRRLVVVVAALASRTLGLTCFGLVVEVSVVLVQLASLVLNYVLDLLQQLKLVVAQLLRLNERVLNLQHDLLATAVQVPPAQQALLLLQLGQYLYRTSDCGE